ncbi:hypothetical protein KCU88_g975, partial [Aureobasidium melanogenum]
MVLPRSSALRGSIRSFTLRRAGTQARTNLRAIGRRGYASEHGTQKSSDLPWLIGSVAVTVPAASWLLSQGPKTSDHGHHDESHATEKHEEAPAEESTEQPTEESEEKTEEKSEESQEDAGQEGGQTSDGRSETSEEETTKGSLPEGESRISEKQGDKGAQKDVSGASNPFMGADEESKKPEGMAATAKIKGTVDPSRPTGASQKGADKSKEQGDDDTSN